MWTYDIMFFAHANCIPHRRDVKGIRWFRVWREGFAPFGLRSGYVDLTDDEFRHWAFATYGVHLVGE